MLGLRVLFFPPLAGVWRSRRIADCGVSVPTSCLARGAAKILVRHAELLEVLDARHVLDPVAVALVGHDGQWKAVPRGVGRADEHALPRVLAGLVAEVPVALDHPLEPLARVAGVVEELLGGFAGAEDAELWFGLWFGLWFKFISFFRGQFVWEVELDRHKGRVEVDEHALALGPHGALPLARLRLPPLL